MSWSWLPNNFSWGSFIPAFTPPVSIQRRFISFVLKRTLGHLVKPGQLDVDQVDAQLGRGFVEINNLELDVEAVNAHLGDLPCRLQSGVLGKVSFNVPWSNPLSASIGLSVSGLDLTFHLSQVDVSRHPTDNDDLANSVAVMAESFIQDELDDRDTAALRDSLYERDPILNPFLQDPLPGSMDPFLEQSTTMTDSVEGDPEGISIFARLIERLLARFNFDATDIRVAFVHPNHAVYTCSIGNIQYSTEDKPHVVPGHPDSPVNCQTRSLGITQVSFSVKPIHIRDDAQARSSPTPYDSDSEMDDEAQMAMSQSILSLPMHSRAEKPMSLTLSTISSAASSMYESAISAVELPPSPSHVPQPTDTTLADEPDETQPILTFVEPISLQLTTPPPYLAPRPSSVELAEAGKPIDDKLKFRVSLGAIAISINTQSLRLIMGTTKSLQAASPPTKPANKSPRQTEDSSPNVLDNLECSLDCNFIVLLLHPSNSWPSCQKEATTFHSHPLTPPRIPSGFVRICIESIDSTFSAPKSHSSRTRPQQSPTLSEQIATCTIRDISILAFHSISGLLDNQPNLCSPIIITDPFLQLSVDAQKGFVSTGNVTGHGERVEEGFPVLILTDWIRGKAFGTEGLQQWRTRRREPSPHGARQGLGDAYRTGGKTHSVRDPHAVHIEITNNEHGSQRWSNVTVQTLPIHVFLDLASIAVVTSTLAEVLVDSGTGPSAHDTTQEGKARTVEIHDESGAFREEPHEDRDEVVGDSSNRSVVENWDSGCREPFTHVSCDGHNDADNAKSTEVRINFNTPLLRIDVCSPPPRTRSGSLIVDIHQFSISLNPKLSDPPPSTQFKDSSKDAESEISDWLKGARSEDVVIVSFSKALVAYSVLDSQLAEGFLSVQRENGPNIDTGEIWHNSGFSGGEKLGDRPTIIVRNGAPNYGHVAKAVLVHVPVVRCSISKDILDGLQIWADDASQLFEAQTKQPSTDAAPTSGSVSLAGSSTASQRSGALTTNDSTNQSKPPDGLIVKAIIGQASVQLKVPVIGATTLRFIEAGASAIDILAEMNVEQQNQMTVTLGVKSVSISERHLGNSNQAIDSLPQGASSKPVVRLRFQSSPVPNTTAKESYMRLETSNLLVQFWSELEWLSDLAAFVKPPPGVFETVVPSERTTIELKLCDTAVRVTPPSKPCAFLLSLEDVTVKTGLSSHTPEIELFTAGDGLSILLIDDVQSGHFDTEAHVSQGLEYWRSGGYVLILHIDGHDVQVRSKSATGPPDNIVVVNSVSLQVHLCADTATGITVFASDMQTLFKSTEDSVPSPTREKREPHAVPHSQSDIAMLRSLDEQAFKRIPEIGPLADMIDDDLPSNLEYIDESFGAAAGLRELTDEDLEEDFIATTIQRQASQPRVQTHGGETVSMLLPSLNIIEGYYETLTPITHDTSDSLSSIVVRVSNCDIRVLLYDGYDWGRTKKAIQTQIKNVKRRLAKIRQLLASGQTCDPDSDDLNTTLFNSVYVGLDQDVSELEGDELAAAIDEELNDASEYGSESSWQSFRKRPVVEPKGEKRPSSLSTRNLDRSRSPSIEFSVQGLSAAFDQYLPNQPLVSKVLVTIRDFEILDHIRTSTWSKFLTAMLKDSRGNVRESESNMVKVELQTLQPVRGRSEQEARLRAKVLPLKLHVDQDALDFLKKFFSFSDPDAAPSASKDETFFQHVEVFPVDIKLDYKPRRVDYRALREGKTIELMNFFHFDGAEMTLRHITLKGVTGWARIGEILNDLWTPDVKANQLVDVISGVSPIRSAVNMGSGVADLVLLPIAQYKKDGRVIRGLQKGTKAFIKSTAMEALQLGARLATGTQVILEQAESVLGGQYKDSVTAEAMYVGSFPGDSEHLIPEVGPAGEGEMISKYAEQPVNVKEGVHSAYRTLSQNIKSAGQTILAVPMEVYEQAGKEGPARAIIRAVPIAVLKPMIGASEAVSKTLLGLRNTLEPSVHHENEVKYKHR